MKKYSLNLVINDIEDIVLNNITIYGNIQKSQTIGCLNYYSNHNIEVSDCSVNDVSLNKDKNYYFILPTQNILYKDLCNLFENQSVSNNLLKLFLNNNLKILFINLYEVENTEYITKFLNILKSKNVNLNRVFLINNDSKINEHNFNFNWNINTYKTYHIESFTREKLLNVYSKYIANKSSNLFLNLNHTARPHRLILLSILHSNNLLNNTNYSLLSNRNYSDEKLINFIGKDLYSNIKNSMNYLESRIPIMISDESDKSHILNLNLGFYIPNDIYLNSYINMVTETVFFSNTIHITEKSLKPFYFYQLPLIFASHNHLKYLKLFYKFDVFDDIIDHSYDDEPDDFKRLLLFINEVKRLNNNKEYIISNYKNLNDRLEQNKKIIYEINPNQIDLDSFKEIYNKKI